MYGRGRGLLRLFASGGARGLPWEMGMGGRAGRWADGTLPDEKRIPVTGQFN